MTDTVQGWIDLVDSLYPERDAESWDQVGLQVGDPRDEVHRVLVSLDVTDAVLDEAVSASADLVLAHHPLLFRPLARLTPLTASGGLALRAARERIGLLAAHTNLDAAVPGTTDPIVEALGLVDVVALRPVPDAGRVKLVVFTPPEATGAVLAALSGAGAGVIGEYDRCSFRVAGTGTFRPSAQANPTVGERGGINEVDEERLEVVVPRDRLVAAVAAMVGAHPYEEVAYDAVPLVDVPDAGSVARSAAGSGPGGNGVGKGIGRVGQLPEPTSLRTIADRLAAALPSPHLRLAGDPERLVDRVAACGGAGDSLIADAHASGAQLYVTGDLRHHVALDAMGLGLSLIDAGHYATEAAALPTALEALDRAAREHGLQAGLLPSRVRTEPWADYRPGRGINSEKEGVS